MGLSEWKIIAGIKDVFLARQNKNLRKEGHTHKLNETKWE
jgi:hypothetical protein